LPPHPSIPAVVVPPLGHVVHPPLGRHQNRQAGVRAVVLLQLRHRQVPRGHEDHGALLLLLSLFFLPIPTFSASEEIQEQAADNRGYDDFVIAPVAAHRGQYVRKGGGGGHLLEGGVVTATCCGCCFFGGENNFSSRFAGHSKFPAFSICPEDVDSPSSCARTTHQKGVHASVRSLREARLLTQKLLASTH
jgi:hypothetical protein